MTFCEDLFVERVEGLTEIFALVHFKSLQHSTRVHLLVKV